MLAAAAPATDDAQRAQLRRLRRVEYLQTKSRWWTHDTRSLKAALLDWALVGSQAPLTKAWRAHRRRVVADLVRLAFVGTRLKPTVAGAREACAAAAATRGFPARHVWRCALRNAAAAGEAEVVVESIMAFYDDRYVVSSAEVRVVAPGAH